MPPFDHDPVRSSPPRQAVGFTLVELLVVIGIIATLIGILLPAILKARAAANSVACMANLRGLAQAMTTYTSENNGYLPGAGVTTGAGVWQYSAATATVSLASGSTSQYPLGAMECTDWATPLARVMGLHPLDPVTNTNAMTTDDVKIKYRAFRDEDHFICPSYRGVTSSPSGSSLSGMTLGQAWSYNTALGFLTVVH